MRLSTLACWATVILLAGCGKADDPFAGAPAATRFTPLDFFTGHVRSWGVIEDRGGAPTRTVVTDCQGTRTPDGSLHLVQHLTFGDGTTQERDWTMRQTGTDTLDATANDMDGTARGHIGGPLFHWRWTLVRSPGNPLLDVGMEQWMYRLPDGSVMIRTTISKLGIILAEVSEHFAHIEG